jgi:predicted GNAT family N-acyltransferase
MVRVELVSSKQQLDSAFSIRREVFVVEQQVPADEEYDEWEGTSRHFLAYDEKGSPCGTARWRHTTKGIKLERFAVLENYRNKGVGSALVKEVLQDVELQPDTASKILYLHAQLTAMPLYAKFGFVADGPEFLECGIKHHVMKKL